MKGQMMGLISLVKNQRMSAYQQQAMQHSMMRYLKGKDQEGKKSNVWEEKQESKQKSWKKKSFLGEQQGDSKDKRNWDLKKRGKRQQKGRKERKSWSQMSLVVVMMEMMKNPTKLTRVATRKIFLWIMCFYDIYTHTQENGSGTIQNLFF
jgi:hypothetical protein